MEEPARFSALVLQRRLFERDGHQQSPAPNNVDVTRLCDVIPDPNDNTADSEGLNNIDHFARFMHATKVPPRDTALATSSDGVVQTGGQETAQKMRTPPLWGVRTRTELLHDGRSVTFFDTIQRHGNEAQPVLNNFNNLSTTQQNQLITFLRSL